ncbi:MMPL family transporter [Vibrio sp. S11_S32]|uniref:MMPL family transporter n=1 Tax=Vibrio sp. S11_S32 TaxID=2720225 RepID=UPI001680A4CF|nr:MMPL family transporter [Vibrio sp. S11_S32]MBD1577504.1 MMPL family transporter [Vibrio sp. S11_S32]
MFSFFSRNAKSTQSSTPSWPYVLCLLCLCVSSYFGVVYSQAHFNIDSDLNHLVEQDAAWKDNLNKTSQQFGDSESSLVVVISGDDRQKIQQVTEHLTQDFSRTPLFKDVFSPSTLPWLKQQALWFLSKQEFNDFNHNLSALLPRLQTAAMSQSTSKNQSSSNPAAPAMQLLAQLNQAIETKDEKSAKLLISALNQVADIDHANQTETPNKTSANQSVNWLSLLFPQSKTTNYQIISVNAIPQRDQKEPNRIIMETAHQLINKYANLPNVKVRLTGQTALDFDEIKDANHSVKLAGAMSLIGLIIILGFGIRSVRIIVASYIAVIVGLIWTLAVGLWLVGSYNTISIVFLVMFIGLGVDFSIHFCLRIREEQGKHDNNTDCLKASVRGTFVPLSLCALTSAIGFLGFYPTAYTGLAELGIISAAGMLMGLLATFTVIPVFFFLFGYPKYQPQAKKQVQQDGEYWLVKHHKLVIGIAIGLLIVTGIGASQMRFDFSTLVLKSPHSESVQTLEEIQQQGLTSSYQMMMLASSPAQAKQWQQKLSHLPEVSNALSINSFLPQDRQSRMMTLAKTLQQPPAAAAHTIQLEPLISKLEHTQGVHPSTLKWLKNTPPQDLYRSISRYALLPLSSMQQNMQQMMQAPQPTIKDIPQALAQRYYNQDYALVVAYPSGNMRDVKQLDQFIAAVQKIAPNATGRPVAEQQVGKIITTAFIQATCYSLGLIALVLLFALKHKHDVVLSFIPLLLTTLSTMAVAHWSGYSLNMANIIVIPLIFGLGVDNGIHIVERFRSVGSVKEFYQSSTPKAAILSSLTTIVTFGSLLLADHRGMFSIGFLLTIAIGFLLLYSLTVLPALLFSVKKH